MSSEVLTLAAELKNLGGGKKVFMGGGKAAMGHHGAELTRRAKEVIGNLCNFPGLSSHRPTGGRMTLNQLQNLRQDLDRIIAASA